MVYKYNEKRDGESRIERENLPRTQEPIPRTQRGKRMDDVTGMIQRRRRGIMPAQNDGCFTLLMWVRIAEESDETGVYAQFFGLGEKIARCSRR